VVYSSATGATDVRNMAYMTRLGLWGIGTSFPGGFQEFMQEIESGGVGAMEMVSRDMKALGMYLSGSISFGVCPQSGKAVEYRERIHRLTPQQREMYNRAADAWQSVLRNIDAALEATNGGPRARAVALNKFWGGSSAVLSSSYLRFQSAECNRGNRSRVERWQVSCDLACRNWRGAN